MIQYQIIQKSMNEINSRSKTIILHNLKEIIHDDKKTKYDKKFKTVSNILKIISSIKIIKMHSIGKIDIDITAHAYMHIKSDLYK